MEYGLDKTGYGEADLQAENKMDGLFEVVTGCGPVVIRGSWAICRDGHGWLGQL